LQKLEIYQSLWGMQQRAPGKPEQPPEQHFSQIAEAGFNGVCLDPGITQIAESQALKPLFDRHQLGCMINAFPNKSEELKPLLDLAASLNASQVNIIGGVMPLKPSDAASMLRSWLAIAADYPMPILMETHRNGTLNDLFYTLQVLQEVPGLRLCADLSHFVVDREFPLPISKQNAQYMDLILERSDSFQGRVSNNEQIQIAINFPQHKLWLDQYLTWWRQGMSGWSARNGQNETLRFLVELGPPPYAITDSAQQELSDRWQESLQIKSMIEQIWQDIAQPPRENPI